MRVGRASHRKPGTRATDASRKTPGDRTDRRVQAKGASRTPGLRKSQRRNSRRKLAVQPKASRRKSRRRKLEAQPKASWRRGRRRKPEAQPKAET